MTFSDTKFVHTCGILTININKCCSKKTPKKEEYHCYSDCWAYSYMAMASVVSAVFKKASLSPLNAQGEHSDLLFLSAVL